MSRFEKMKNYLHSLYKNKSEALAVYDVYIRGAAEALKKQCFKRIESYSLYFMLEAMTEESDFTSVLLLDRDFYMLGLAAAGKRVMLSFEALTAFIDREGERCKAEYAIIFRKTESSSFKSEFDRANYVFYSLKKVKLYDYVLKSEGIFKSFMASLRQYP